MLQYKSFSQAIKLVIMRLILDVLRENIFWNIFEVRNLFNEKISQGLIEQLFFLY